jgi:hypothetical protein
MPLKRSEIVLRCPLASSKACMKPSTRMRSRRPESWPSNGIGQLLTAWSASLKPSNGVTGPVFGRGVDLDRASVWPNLRSFAE